MAALLRGGLVVAAERELPEGAYKVAAIRQLRELAGLTQELDNS